MKKKNLKESPESKKRAELLKKALLESMVEVTNTKQKKIDFGQFAGLSLSGVDSFIYEGRGSFETWANAILYRFKLKAQDVADKIPELTQIVNLTHPLTESGKLWHELDQILKEEDKILYLTMIKVTHELTQRKKGNPS